MRRLSSYPGLSTPGVSTRTAWPSGRVSIPRILKRVVCGLFETAAIFSPTSRLSKVDLPALGRPMRATYPARKVLDELTFDSTGIWALALPQHSAVSLWLTVGAVFYSPFMRLSLMKDIKRRLPPERPNLSPLGCG